MSVRGTSWRRALGALAAVLTIALAPATVSAATASAAPSRTPAQIAATVFHSADPAATLRSLSSADRATFAAGLTHQTSRLVVSRGGAWTPTAAEAAAMSRSAAPATIRALAAPMTTTGCWYHYYYRSWSDLGIHDGDSWMQLNWCGSSGRVTSWSQSNVGCAGHSGASCSVGGTASLNVGWEIRTTRYYNADFFGFKNTFCMQIRGGATGLYSQSSSASSGCPLS